MQHERVLFHYNGHGVPRPTPNGEIWVFNKSYTQYIPLSVIELRGWVGTPAIFVFDCSAAGLIVNAFKASLPPRVSSRQDSQFLFAFLGWFSNFTRQTLTSSSLSWFQSQHFLHCLLSYLESCRYSCSGLGHTSKKKAISTTVLLNSVSMHQRDLSMCFGFVLNSHDADGKKTILMLTSRIFKEIVIIKITTKLDAWVELHWVTAWRAFYLLAWSWSLIASKTSLSTYFPASGTWHLQSNSIIHSIVNQSNFLPGIVLSAIQSETGWCFQNDSIWYIIFSHLDCLIPSMYTYIYSIYCKNEITNDNS